MNEERPNYEAALQVFSDCQRAYRLVFNTAAGQATLADLAVFCRANETCVVPGDHDRTLLLEGRRETYLRIQDYLKLKPEELVERFTRPAA